MDGSKPVQLEAFVRYVDMVRPERVYIVRLDNDIALKQRVVSKLDSVHMYNAGRDVWAKLTTKVEEKCQMCGGTGKAEGNLLRGRAVEIFPAEGYVWADDRMMGPTE